MVADLLATAGLGDNWCFVDQEGKFPALCCCQATRTCDTGDLEGWMDAALAVDATRAARLRAAGYEVHTQTVPEEITPKNRLLLGAPA